ncbi:MAG: hypothetical protein K6T28_09830 [Acidothermus sp.]|nr:hypothetical protein [Acidothermus sp.]
MGLFVGLPTLLLFSVASRANVQLRRQRTAALRLIGASADVLTRTAALEAAVTAAVGSTIGILAAWAVLPQVSRRGTFGLRWWFAGISVPATVIVIVGTAWAFARAARWQTTRLVRHAQEITDNAEPRPRLWWVPIGLTAFAIQLILIGISSARPDQVLNAPPTTGLMLLADGCALLGTLGTMPWLVGKAAHFLRSRVTQSHLLVAAARASFRPDDAVRSSAGLFLLITVGMAGLGVLTDFRAQQHADSGMHPIALPLASSAGGPSTWTRAAALTEGHPWLLVPLDDVPAGRPPEAVLVADCATLATRALPLSFPPGEKCRDHTLYRVAGNTTPGIQTDDQSVVSFGVPSGTVSFTDPGTIPDGVIALRTDRPTLWAAHARRGVLVFAVPSGPSEEHLISSLLAIDPEFDPGDEVTDFVSYYQFPVIERLLEWSVAMGLLIVGAAYALATYESVHRRRNEDAGLRLLGASRRTLRRATSAESLGVCAIAAVLAAVVGWATGRSYLAVGGDHVLFLRSILVAAAGFALTALGVTLSVILSIRRPQALEAERRE